MCQHNVQIHLVHGVLQDVKYDNMALVNVNRRLRFIYIKLCDILILMCNVLIKTFKIFFLYISYTCTYIYRYKYINMNTFSIYLYVDIFIFLLCLSDGVSTWSNECMVSQSYNILIYCKSVITFLIFGKPNL